MLGQELLMMDRKAARNMYRVVIPIKLELSASVGFIHKESILLLYSTPLALLIFERNHDP